MISKNSCDQVLSNTNDVALKESNYEWVIKNLSQDYRKVHGPRIRSPVFSFDIDPEIEWQITLEYGTTDTHSLTVYLIKGATASKNIHASLYILNVNKDELKSTTCQIDEALAVNGAAISMSFSINSTKAINLDLLARNNLPSNNSVIIQFKVLYYSNVSTSVHAVYNRKKVLLQPDRFEKFFDNDKFSDARIIVDDYVFNVHKCILSAGSAYFSAMFDNDMKENKDSKVEITDVSREVMQEVLRFIYAGKINNLETLKMDLFVAADKYMIEGLKILCEEALIQDLKVENILDMLKFVERYDSENLKTAAFNFFHVHNKEIITLSEYETSLKTYSTSTVAAMFKQLTF